ncbi:hypothetical protein CEXT_207331 [Caerostris extrusa]|uniref:Uncharacterized protein n=1 Tax=Caerostris extrusa TaxID=172846 RepID=A0AAV4WGQ3_CAEEX|nr:hypothetical protein CEXT_207331 [Caerostris extrusa]
MHVQHPVTAQLSPSRGPGNRFTFRLVLQPLFIWPSASKLEGIGKTLLKAKIIGLLFDSNLHGKTWHGYEKSIPFCAMTVISVLNAFNKDLC